MKKPVEKKGCNATAIRLGELKAPLQREAMNLDRSLHWLIRKILKAHVDAKKEVEY